MSAKSPRKPTAPQAIQPQSYSEPKRVTIEKAKNGYTVSHHTCDGHHLSVAKNHKEAMRHVKKALK